MGMRQEFIDYVKNGGEKPVVSMQIGAGAGFDTKLAGKEWVSETTLDDLIAAYEKVQCLPLFNIGMGFDFVPEFKWENFEVSASDEYRDSGSRMETPYGELVWNFREQKKHGMTPTKYPLTIDSNLDVVKWYAEQIQKNIHRAGELLVEPLAKLQPHGPVSVQWALQPFELFGLSFAVPQAMMLMDDPDYYRDLCDMIRDINIELMTAVYKAGADFVFLGGPGSEAASPMIYEDFLIPDSKKITDAAHAMGGLIYSHICSPIQPFLDKGFYNRMGIDLFETLSPPPVGNVADLKAARERLPAEMCTRGNIGLDVLLNGSREKIEQETLRILDATKGFKHMVAASDYMFYEIPFENVKTIVETVKNYR